jgi:hypothetical protein
VVVGCSGSFFKIEDRLGTASGKSVFIRLKCDATGAGMCAIIAGDHSRLW